MSLAALTPPPHYALIGPDSPFQSNVVLRWEWRPGSILYLVWQQSRGGPEDYFAPVGFGDLFGSLSAPGDNILAVKTTVWISR
jgi:hypothetical protein